MHALSHFTVHINGRFLFLKRGANMLIVYDTRAGKVKKFVEKCEMRSLKVEPHLEIDEPFIFVTYTDGKGEIPKTSIEFLEKFGHHMQGVAASGNRVFEYFAVSADLIAAQYHVPIIHKFEFAGLQKDVIKFKEWIGQHAAHLVK